jgi:hypothetical protein
MAPMTSAPRDAAPSAVDNSFATGEGPDWPVASLDIRRLHHSGSLPEGCNSSSLFQSKQRFVGRLDRDTADGHDRARVGQADPVA